MAGTCSDSPMFEPRMVHVTYLQVSSRTYATVQETDCSQTEECGRGWSKGMHDLQCRLLRDGRGSTASLSASLEVDLRAL